MNVDLADRLGAKPVEAELKVIDGFKEKKQLAALDLRLEKRVWGGGVLSGRSRAGPEGFNQADRADGAGRADTSGPGLLHQG